MSIKSLVIGSGFLGRHIINEFEGNGIQTIGTHFQRNDSSLKIDIRILSSVDKIISDFSPDLIINCAASTHLDFLEKNPDIAFSINSEGAKNVAISAQKNKIKLIHISTDGIFDGIRGMYTENDLPNPVNVYAKSKALGERMVIENSENFIIVRTNFYGFDINNQFLFNWIYNELKQKKKISGFNDVIFTPLEVTNLSKLLLELSNTEYQGIIHLASDEIMSKYQFALNIAHVLGFDKNLIVEDSVNNHVGFVAKRPKNTSLSNNISKKFLKTPIIPMTQWLHQLKKSNNIVF